MVLKTSALTLVLGCYESDYIIMVTHNYVTGGWVQVLTVGCYESDYIIMVIHNYVTGGWVQVLTVNKQDS